MSISDPDRTVAKPTQRIKGHDADIDRRADAFDQAWRDGKKPSLADEIGAAPPALRPALLAQLACIDLEYRLRAGEPLDAMRYARDFPDLWAANPDVAREIEECAAKLRPDDDDIADINRKLGGHAARYRVHERLGEGGMGSVYLANQRAIQEGDLERSQVALKVIALGMNSREIVARFDAERQAMALMSHPGIAMVFDAGLLTDGRPYFVMEFVPGRPINEFADAHKLTIDARLRLFQQVCDAVQHAHAKGIIHRDIKPTNILAYMDGNTARIKVIDFGLAKALGEKLTDRTMYTGINRVMGTLAFMAPEQIAGDPDIDARCDVYALGALLYELLAGVNAFDFKRLSEDQIRRLIRETDPPKPDTRLQSLDPEHLSKLSASRSATPDALRQDLGGELAWIPLKAMKKLRHERYESVLALRQDIERYLNFQPLLAGPDSAIYRIKKSIARNRGRVAVLVTALTLLIAGTIVFFNSRPEELVLEPPTTQAITGKLRRGSADLEVYENRMKMQFVKLPAPGEFLMGSPTSELGRSKTTDESQHNVKLTGIAYMGITEVTLKEWKFMMDIPLAEFHQNDSPDHPMHTVSLAQIDEFCAKLSAADTKFNYRLPTEAEWEYACRAGTTTAFCSGNDFVAAREYGWFQETFGDKPAAAQPVKKRKPNAWGIYDMHGNLWEWVRDDYGQYKDLPEQNPLQKTPKPDRVARGGCFNMSAGFARSARRSHNWGADLDDGGAQFGFRLVAEPK